MQSLAVSGPGSILQFTFNPNVGDYQYIQATSISAYTWQAGDYVEYDVYIDPANQLDGKVGFDSYGWPCSGGLDQNGKSGAATTDLRPYALGQWYSRKIAIDPSFAGTTSPAPWLFMKGADAGGTMVVSFRNVRITDGAGTVRKRIWIDPDPNPTFAIGFTGGSTSWSETLVGAGYSAEEVAAQLGASAEEDWVFDHLDCNGKRIKDLSAWVNRDQNPQVVHDSTAAVKRSLTISLRGDCGVTPLRDLIQPHYRLRMPDGGWADWCLGTFVMMLPDKHITSGATWWTCTLPDLSQLLLDAGLGDPVSVEAGASVSQAISVLLAAAAPGMTTPMQPLILGAPTAKLPASLGWNLGDAVLQAINDLLTGSAFQTVWCDETLPLPQLRSSLIPDFNTVVPSFTFDATAAGTNVLEGMQETTDPSNIYNDQWVVGEDPRHHEPQVGHYVNTNPLSPYSVGKWHLKTAPTIRDTTIPDRPSAYARARAEVQAAARIGATLLVDTFAWPASEDRDVYRLIYETADEGLRTDLFLETKWTHVCAAGQPTQHELERLEPA